MNTDVLRRLFAEYYERMASTIYVTDVSMREFMFMTFDGRVVRHIAFRSVDALRNYLRTEPPLHAYHSVSLYRNPTAPMEEKEPIRSELLFDIDSTDFNDAECERDSIWRCKDCGKTGKGPKPEKCSSCGSPNIAVNHWMNERCIELAKVEVEKLSSILTDDLGVDPDDIALSYTGNRGFHVRVMEGDLIKVLDKDARRELAFYVMMKGFKPILHIRNAPDGGVTLNMSSGHVRRVVSLILSGELGVDGRLRRAIERMSLGDSVKLSPKERRKLVQLLTDASKLAAARIDWMVTADPSRLTRIPNTLHGKTGFRALRLTLEEYKGFDPFTDAVGLSDEPEVAIRITMEVPRFRLKRESFGPFRPGAAAKLPAFAAAFLILRGRAELGG